MEDEDYRTIKLNGSHLKVFRDGRIHSLNNRLNKWTNRKYTLTEGGYYRLDIRRRIFFVHNIISLCYLGIKPDGYQTDHINNIRTDNRLENLQYLTLAENQRKCLMIKGRPIKGYRQRGNKYEASIKHLGKSFNLGTFETEEDARQAYIDAKLKYHNVVVN